MSAAGSELLERDLELERIEAAIEAGCTGEGSVLFIDGPPGIGKTSLLRCAARMAADRMTVLSARATELEREFAFGAVRQMLEPPLRSASHERRAELLDGAAAHAAPALGLDVEARRPPGADPGFATLNGLYWLVAGLGEERPLLLALDDAHWADRDSLRFLSFLVPRLPDVPVLLLAAARSHEWPSEAAFAATASDPASRPLAPSALSLEATLTVVESAFGAGVEPAFAQACHRATGGNPFYLRALLDELKRDGVRPTASAAPRSAALGPRAVTQAVVARLARLSQAAPRLARVVAILGEDATHERATRLAGLEEGEAATATDEMVEVSILGASAERLAFVHPIIRNAVYEGIGRADRGELHRRAAWLLRAEGAASERVAAHLLAGEPSADPAVVSVLRVAAVDALRRGAVGSATAYLRRALAEPPGAEHRLAVLRELGSAETLVDGPAAIAHLEEALELADMPLDRAAVATDLARALIFAGRGPEGVAIAERALAGLDARHGERRRLLEAMIFAVARTDPDFAGAREALVSRLRASEPHSAEDVGAKSLAAGLAYVDAHACAPAAEVVPRAQDALAGGLLLEHDNGGADFIAAVVVLAMADSDLVLPTLSQGLDLARDRGDVFALAANMIFACLAHLVRGDLRAAVAAGEEGLAASDSYGMGIARAWGGGYLASAQLASGDVDGAERTLARAGAPENVPFNATWAPFVDARARIRLERGEVRAALDDSRWCGDLLDALGQTNPALIPWRSRAAVCLGRLGGDPDEALALVDEEVELARRWGVPKFLGAALRARAVVTGGGEEVAMLRESLDVLPGSGAELERGRTLVELGAALRRGGRRRSCRAPLREGMAAARNCGATSLAERAYLELRASGARPRKLIHAGVDALTPSERRIATLAAEGRTNRRIAQELFLSVKTVEWHLGQVFRKLDISSRDQLSRALGE